MENEKNIHAKHRQRLRKLVETSNFNSLSEIQILEYILTFSIPRSDTNPLAHLLLNKFGNLHKVIEADYSQLMSIKGVGPKTASFLKTYCKIFHHLIENGSTEKTKTVLTTPNEMIDAFKNYFFGKTVEEFYIAYLTAKNELIKIEQISTGTINSVEIDIKKISQDILSYGASLVILAHNHPQGEAYPSGEDILATEKIFNTLSIFNVGLLDHFIITPTKVFSFNFAGYLDQIRTTQIGKGTNFSNKLLSLVTNNGIIELEKERKTSVLDYPNNIIGS